MTTNYHTAWENGITQYTASDMNAPLSELDSKITGLDSKEFLIASNYLNAKPGNSHFIQRIAIAKYMVLPDGAPGSYANADTAATAQAVFTIKRGGTTVGTITFAASSAIGTFSVSGDKAFNKGSVLSITAPASQDATLENISITLRLTRPASANSTTTTSTTT